MSITETYLSTPIDCHFVLVSLWSSCSPFPCETCVICLSSFLTSSRHSSLKILAFLSFSFFRFGFVLAQCQFSLRESVHRTNRIQKEHEIGNLKLKTQRFYTGVLNERMFFLFMNSVFGIEWKKLNETKNKK